MNPLIKKLLGTFLYQPPETPLTKANSPEEPEVLVGSAWGLSDTSARVADLALVTAIDYAAIRAIATHASNVHLDLMEYDEGTGHLRRVPASDSRTELLRFPNTRQTTQEFVEAAIFYQELFGHVPLHLGRDKSGLVSSVYPVRPDKLEIADQDDSGHLTYRFTDYASSNPTRTIDGDDIVVVRHFNPVHPVWGRSPGQAARKSLLLDFHAHQFNVSFFANNAMPGVILESERMLTRLQKKRLRAAWRAAFGGSTRAHGVAVLTAGLKATPVSPNHADMEFSQLLSYTAREILAVRGVPPVILGITDGASTASAQEQRHSFLVGTLRPTLGRLLGALNRHVFRPLGAVLVPDYESFQTTAQTLHERRLEVRGYFRDGIVTRNEARAMLGLDPAPRDGDVYFNELNPNVGGVGPSAATTTPTTPMVLDRPDHPDVTLQPGNGSSPRVQVDRPR